jgi:hypothetical protein
LLADFLRFEFLAEIAAMGENAVGTVEEAPFPLTDVDKWVLSLTDEEYQYHTWDELREIVGRSSLGQKRENASLIAFCLVFWWHN